MALTGEAAAIFDDARLMHEAALERLAAGDVRDAAEKAWCAIKGATYALVLVRTGQEPRTSGQTRRALGTLEDGDVGLRPLRERYGFLQTYLHGGCFYDGDCDGPTIPGDIRSVGGYIEDAECLAQQ